MNCHRCNCDRQETRDAQLWARRNQAISRRDAPYLLAGYCSAMCQAFDMRDAMIRNGFDPATWHRE